MAVNINHIFPTAIGTTFYELSKKEINFIKESPWRNNIDSSMKVTENTYILEDKELSSLKEFIETSLNDYSSKTLGTKQKLKITQSWATKHKNIANKHNPHHHPNSILSGCIYIQFDNTNEGITFFNPRNEERKTILWKQDESLCQDASTFNWTKVEHITEGELVLFPSSLKHGVMGDDNYTSNDRISLSFNTWFKEPIGDEWGLTELKL